MGVSIQGYEDEAMKLFAEIKKLQGQKGRAVRMGCASQKGSRAQLMTTEALPVIWGVRQEGALIVT